MSTPETIESVYVARQPIFTLDKALWGYELLFRSSGEANLATISDENKATSQVIADGFLLAQPDLKPGQRVLINFPEHLLVQGTAFALPTEACVVEILETVNPTKEVLTALDALKKDGYMLAMDDYAGEVALEPFLDVVDLVKVDILALTDNKRKLELAVHALKRRNLELLAEKVEDQETFQFCVDLGFRYFQGFFFSKPEIIPGRKVSAGETAKIQLLYELSLPDFELDKISEIIHTDPSLSYRLFRYINSVGFNLSAKISSVSHAVNMLGQLRISQWLRAVILSDMNPSPRAKEVSYMSLSRARFLALIAQNTAKMRQDDDTLFMLGLFSLLDALMDLPMEEIMQQIPLPENIKGALTGQKNELGTLLDLVSSYEHGNFESMDALSKKVGMHPKQTDALYSEAVQWTQAIMRSARGGEF